MFPGPVRRFFSRPAQRRPSGRRREIFAKRLCLEQLEDRTVPSALAQVVTDQPDYSPGETVQITGTAFEPNESVTLQVVHEDGTTAGEGHDPWVVAADANGAFSSTWYINPDDSAGATFDLFAAGDLGSSASTTFTDAPIDTTLSKPSLSTTSLVLGDSVVVSDHLSTADGNVAGHEIRLMVSINGGSVSNTGLTAFTDAGGNVSFTYTPSAGGTYVFLTHLVPADLGNNGYGEALSPTSDTLTVSAPTSTTTSIAAPTVTYGQDLAITVTVSPNTGSVVPTGSVTLTVASTSYGPATLDASGQATFTISNLSASTYSLAATYTPTGTFTGSSASGSGTVDRANASITINPYSGTYDGDAHGLTGSATGVKSEDLSSLLDLGASYTDVGSYTVGWSFAGNKNYESAGGTSTIDIAKAHASITINPYSGTYDGNAHGLTGSATGVKSEDLSSLLNLGATYTDAGHYTVSWSFAGNKNYESAGGTSTIDIAKAYASITINPYSGTYDGNAHGLTGSATGVKSEDLSGLLNLGASYTDAGHYTVSWSFAGNKNYESAGGSSTIDIAKAPTATIFTATPPTSSWGDSVTFTVAVSVVGMGGGVSGGQVIFSEADNTLAAVDIQVSGGIATASFATSALEVGPHVITATYQGTSNLEISSATFAHTVGQNNTITSLLASASIIQYGDTVTFTATVVPGGGMLAGAITGTVTFMQGNTTLGSGSVQLVGEVYQATFDTAALSGGHHNVQAVYGGDAHYGSSSSAPVDVLVINSMTQVTSSRIASVFGASVSFTAMVTPLGTTAMPTGTVTFKDGDTVLATKPLTSRGTVAFTTSALAVASHTISVVYNGAGSYTGSTSAPIIQVVSKAQTRVLLSSSARSALWGQSVTISATLSVVAPATGKPAAPTGTVTFMDGSNVLGSGNLQLVGTRLKATMVTSSLPIGSHSLTALYSGDDNYLNSTSTPFIQTINKALTKTTLSASATTATAGTPLTFTATLGVLAPGTGVPTGKITFKDGVTVLGTADLQVVDGVLTAVLTTSSLTKKGTHTITAVYAGNSNFKNSVSAGVIVQINPA